MITFDKVWKSQKRPLFRDYNKTLILQTQVALGNKEQRTSDRKENESS